MSQRGLLTRFRLLERHCRHCDGRISVPRPQDGACSESCCACMYVRHVVGWRSNFRRVYYWVRGLGGEQWRLKVIKLFGLNSQLTLFSLAFLSICLERSRSMYHCRYFIWYRYTEDDRQGERLALCANGAGIIPQPGHFEILIFCFAGIDWAAKKSTTCGGSHGDGGPQV